MTEEFHQAVDLEVHNVVDKYNQSHDKKFLKQLNVKDGEILTTYLHLNSNAKENIEKILKSLQTNFPKDKLFLYCFQNKEGNTRVDFYKFPNYDTNLTIKEKSESPFKNWKWVGTEEQLHELYFNVRTNFKYARKDDDFEF